MVRAVYLIEMLQDRFLKYFIPLSISGLNSPLVHSTLTLHALSIPANQTNIFKPTPVITNQKAWP